MLFESLSAMASTIRSRGRASSESYDCNRTTCEPSNTCEAAAPDSPRPSPGSNPLRLTSVMARNTVSPSENGKSKKGKRPKTGPSDHIKRPMNAFMCFAQIQRSRIAAENPGMLNMVISQRIGNMWKELPDNDKQEFRDMASKAKEEHEKNYPDYKYRPKKKKDAGAASRRQPSVPEKVCPLKRSSQTYGRAFKRGRKRSPDFPTDSSNNDVEFRVPKLQIKAEPMIAEDDTTSDRSPCAEDRSVSNMSSGRSLVLCVERLKRPGDLVTTGLDSKVADLETPPSEKSDAEVTCGGPEPRSLQEYVRRMSHNQLFQDKPMSEEEYSEEGQSSDEDTSSDSEQTSSQFKETMDRINAEIDKYEHLCRQLEQRKRAYLEQVRQFDVLVKNLLPYDPPPMPV